MKKILINNNPWQLRVAILNNGRLQNIYFAAHAQETLERAFFKGIVSKVLPGIQTAFVDIGQERAGFLHISEICHDTAFDRMNALVDDEKELTQKKKRSHKPKDIHTLFKEGNQILVQVSKEPVYQKGAKLTTCFTLPGRFFVLMPTISRIGVSKKIESHNERMRLKNIMRESLPDGMGGIIRTTAQGCDELVLKQDLSYLINTWNSIQTKFKTAAVESKIYEDIDLSLQVIRDHLGEDVESVICDSAETQKEVTAFIERISPEHRYKVALYDNPIPLFDFYEVENQIEYALHKKVPLKSGGSLIIESTEAMTVIDVNTGRFVGKSSLEDTILKTNMEAAQEIIRQLILRNIGGLIVIDFIDMATENNRRSLIQFFERILYELDKFQSVVLKISEFGIVQMTRKRSGKTLIQQLTDTCLTCKGQGFVESVQTSSYKVLRAIKAELSSYERGDSLTIKLHPEIFSYIVNTEYNSILELEKLFGIKIITAQDGRIAASTYKIIKK
ncbi:MAG TPA: Rne/Rng family ribonuclease [Candidatus Babeliales bacterium]|jgi:ribonuclease G|nr:Rne/Rng family ribonuclease [Candidatus Babeliales bacterium]